MATIRAFSPAKIGLFVVRGGGVGGGGGGATQQNSSQNGFQVLFVRTLLY